MKSFTKLLICIVVGAFAENAMAQCTEGYTYYGHGGLGWQPNNWFKVIDLDAATLTDAKYPKTGAVDGKSDNLDYGTNTTKAPVGSGTIETPLLDFVGGEFVPSGYTYSIKYHNCVFAPEHNGSAYTKVEDYGETPSGAINSCTINNNTSYITNTYSKKGFIELSRQGSTEEEGSKHGYIQMDGLRAIDKIQWSYSSTSWKRGVMVEVKWGPDEEWEILRSLPSDVGSAQATGGSGYAMFAEQGYEFEESFDMPEDVENEYSIRWRIWDGDETTWKEEYEMGETSTPGYFYKTVNPYGTWQVVRIHQIRVFAGVDGSTFANFTSNISDNTADGFDIFQRGNEICSTIESAIEIYTIDGTLIKQAEGKNVNVAELGKGIYLVKAKAQNGTVKTSKIAL